VIESKKLGKVEIKMQEFFSEKVLKREFFKLFLGKEIPILKWGINVQIIAYN